MALLQKIKEKLGFGTGNAERDDSAGEVTVENEPVAERTETDDGGTAAATEPGDDEETADADDEETIDADDEANETGDADARDEAEGEDEDATEEETTDESEPDVAAEDDEAPASEAGAGDGVPVEEIKGIGPAYAERLAEIGIESVADLANADAAEVAEGTSVGESRATTWIERANEF